MSNSFGKIFKISTFGESHGKAIGALVEGCPSGLPINLGFIQECLDKRRPGQSILTTQRREADTVEILAGILDGKATGMPIMLLIHNTDARSKDYAHITHAFRPSHADYTYSAKYGLHDFNGGGRSSARETAARVAAGGIARQWLSTLGIVIHAWVSQVGNIELQIPYQDLDFDMIEHTPVRCPDPETAAKMIEVIEAARHNQDTVGGVVSAVLTGVPAGWGEPVFDKLHAALGFAMLGINAVKGFEFGSGFGAASMNGSQHNDVFYTKPDGTISTKTNFSGGIQGGISNGEDIYFRVAFKPVATIMQPQNSIDNQSNMVVIQGKGRHDPCVLPRAVPIVEAMAALTLADFGLLARTNRL